MPTCFVCLETLTDPAALPCGHVFCHVCIIRVIRSITPYTHHHFCPRCKHPYTISQADPSMVPPHLQHHISPSVRKLHLDYTIPTSAKDVPAKPTYDQLISENTSLRSCCADWRKRAAVHATATLGLVGLARLARDSALKMKAERDDLAVRYSELKKRFEESQTISTFPPQKADSRSDTIVSPPPLSRAPSPAASDDSYYSDCPECCPALRKRKMETSSEPPLKRSRSSSLKPSAVSPAAAQVSLKDYWEEHRMD